MLCFPFVGLKCERYCTVPPEYFSHLDMSGRRMDLDQRPELAFGSVDMLVPKEYWVQPSPAETAEASSQASTSKVVLEPRRPEPMRIVFAIDVSFTAGKTYMIQQTVRAIRAALFPEAVSEETTNGTHALSDGDETPEQSEKKTAKLPVGARIAILTYDTTVHFYRLMPGLDQPQMLVVSDLDDMFLPAYEGLLVDPQESRWAAKDEFSEINSISSFAFYRTLIEQLLTNIENSFADNMIVEAALGAAAKASLEILVCSRC